MSAASVPPPVDRAALSDYLDGLIRDGRTVTYQDAARALGLEPPQTIHRLVLALEDIMTQDAEADRPLRAAVVVSRVAAGVPAPGFFAHARGLGLYEGAERGEEARRFHHRQLAALGVV